MLLAKVGIRMIAEPQDLRNSLENEKILSLTTIIKQKDGDIAALSKSLKESEEKFKNLFFEVSKPLPKPAPEEIKA
jgi:hypothetical protein